MTDEMGGAWCMVTGAGAESLAPLGEGIHADGCLRGAAIVVVAAAAL
jgi:hypothetical protein